MTAPRSGGTPAAAPAGPWRVVDSGDEDYWWRVVRGHGQPSCSSCHRGGCEHDEAVSSTELLSKEQAEAICEALNAVAAGALSGVTPEPSAHEIASEVERLGAEVASLREAAQECNQAWQQVIVRDTVPGVPRMARAISLLNEVLCGALAPASREPQL